MVRGLDIFKKHFSGFEESYIIIGGTACDIIIDEAGFVPRATKDIDIVLVVEALSNDFVKAFWDFIQEGQYGDKQKNTDDRKYYRFINPANKSFPAQIELFARDPDILDLEPDSKFTPIPTDEALSSLSAILLDEDYYYFLLENSSVNDGVRFANDIALISLKARAYLDLSKRKEEGESIDSKNIKKHKTDIFRLLALMNENDSFDLPVTLKKHLKIFSDTIFSDLPAKSIFKDMGLGNIQSENVFSQLNKVFSLDGVIDLEHEVNKLKKQQTPPIVKIKKSKEIVNQILSEVYFPLLRDVNNELQPFNKLFKDAEWNYFEEPETPSSNQFVPKTSTFNNMIKYFDETNRTKGRSSHNYKAIYWLNDYNDVDNFSVEISFKVWFHDYDFRIECFIGQPFESSKMMQSFMKLMKAISTDVLKNDTPFDTFTKYSVFGGKYDLNITAEDIKKSSEEISNKLLEIIKEKAKK